MRKPGDPNPGFFFLRGFAAGVIASIAILRPISFYNKTYFCYTFHCKVFKGISIE